MKSTQEERFVWALVFIIIVICFVLIPALVLSAQAQGLVEGRRPFESRTLTPGLGPRPLYVAPVLLPTPVYVTPYYPPPVYIYVDNNAVLMHWLLNPGPLLHDYRRTR